MIPLLITKDELVVLDGESEVDNNDEEIDEKVLDDYFAALKGKKREICQADVWLAFLRFLAPHASLRLLIIHLLVIPGGNAGIERFIKLIKLIKTKSRNKLKAKMFKKLMAIYCFCDLDHLNHAKVVEAMN